MRVDFYHLTALPLERVLPRLAARVVADGGRLLIVADSDDQQAAIDRLLWSYQRDSFLPHGIAGGQDDAHQPVLIAGAVDAANAARNILLADGVWRDAATGFERAFHLFDEDRIVEARAAWRALAERNGVERRYWKQDDTGRWANLA